MPSTPEANIAEPGSPFQGPSSFVAKDLVVDDDPLLRTEIRDLLRRRGFLIVEAETGLEGVRRALEERPDLIVTDIIMPELDGIEGIHRIRAAWPAARIIAMSGGGRVRNLEPLRLAHSVGADLTIAKPIAPDELLKAVGACLDADQSRVLERALAPIGASRTQRMLGGGATATAPLSTRTGEGP
jgi:DNA-binding response OmpR family regulator